MKYLIGTIAMFIILCIAAYFMLNLWGIDNPLSKENFNKGLLTIGLLSIVSILLVILLPFFFRDHSKGYDRSKGRVARPKKDQFSNN